MSRDIRIAISFKGHRKRKRLRRLIGNRADGHLIDLWISAAIDCPSGILIDWDMDDISDAAGWDGNPEEFIDALIDTKWIEKDKNNNYILHDWSDHQGWVCNSAKRSESAKKAANARWERKNGESRKPVNKGSNAGRNAESNAGSNAGSNAERNAPSPNPYPYPKPNLKESPTNPKPEPKKFTPKKKYSPRLKSGTFSSNKKQKQFEDLPGIFKDIKSKCEEIVSLQIKNPKQRNFNPFGFAQENITNGKHPGAILKVLSGLVLYWETTDSPYGYCVSNLLKYNGNFNADEWTAKQNEMKDISHPELLKLTCGLLKEMPQ